MKFTLKIIISVCLLGSLLFPGQCYACIAKTVEGATVQQTCCKPVVKNNCCCSDYSGNCSCIHTTDNQQTLDKPIIIALSKKIINICYNTIDMNLYSHVNPKPYTLLSHIHYGLVKEVRCILPLLI